MRVENAELFDGTPTKRIIADEGMTCVRIADNIDFGNDVLLGYRYRAANGDLLEERVLEQPEDFREEVAPEVEEPLNIDF